MKSTAFKIALTTAVALCGAAMLTSPGRLTAQAPWPYAPPPMMAVSSSPSAQRNALNAVKTQMGWLENATRTSPNYVGGDDMVLDQFQKLRSAYNTLKMTLNDRQQAQGANQLAELDAGLYIIQEAFSKYQEDLRAGRSAANALDDLCHVLREASRVWMQQLNRDCSRLRVGM